MLVGWFMWWLILTGIIILMLVGYIYCIKFFRKMPGSSGNYAEIIFFLLFPLGLPLVFWLFTSTVYVVDSRTEYSTYYLFGSKTHEFKNGTSADFNSSYTYNIVINNSAAPMVCTEANYGYGYSDGKESEEMYLPFSVSSIKHKIDYFPDETLPSTVSSSFDNSRYYLQIISK